MSEVVELSSVGRLRKANKAQVAEFFDVAVKTVDGWVRRGCPVVQRGSTAKAWVFDVLAVARWRFGNEITPGGEDPDQMSPSDRKSWYESETKRRALQVQDRELIPVEDVERTVATAFSAISQGMRGLPDNIERRTGCDPATVEAIEQAIDAEMDALADKLSTLGPVSDEVEA